jgi:hypothetical protein
LSVAGGGTTCAINVGSGTIREGMDVSGGDRMSRYSRLWWALASFVLIAVACINLENPTYRLIGEPAPAFGVQFQSRTVTLDDMKGQVVVVVFWSST